MHAFMRRLHGGVAAEGPISATPATKGLVLKMDWRHDPMTWAMDTFLFGGALRAMRGRALDLARLQSGERALDAGCGTGALALAAARRVGVTGQVVGIDPGPAQIARAQAKAGRAHANAVFQVGVIERLEFPDASFDAVFSTLMMHHLPAPLKRQGLAEVARVLKPGGRLVIADFRPKRGRQGLAARFHAGGSDAQTLAALVAEAGLTDARAEEIAPPRFSAFPGASFVTARKA